MSKSITVHTKLVDSLYCVFTDRIVPPYMLATLTTMLGEIHARMDLACDKYFLWDFRFGNFGGYYTLDEMVNIIQNAQDKMVEEWK